MYQKIRLISVLHNSKFLFHLRAVNSPQGINQFFKQLNKVIKADPGQCLYCMEFTGVYNFHLVEFLTKQKLPLWLESASRIKASSGMQRGKNDKVDSLRIALYAYKNKEAVKLWQAPRTVIARSACGRCYPLDL